MKILALILLSHLVLSEASEEVQENVSISDGLEQEQQQDLQVPVDETPDYEPEELPEPEAFFGGRRRRPRPPPLLMRHGGAPSDNINKIKSPHMNDLYTSSLNDIQQNRGPSSSITSPPADERVFQHHSSVGLPYTDRDSMEPEESWTWLSRVVPGTRSRRPTIRPRSQPYPRNQGRVRGRGRPGNLGGRIRFRGRQNLRRPPPVFTKRPRTPFSQTAVRPRFRGPSVAQRPPPPPPPPTFPVTEPTTTTPDTLSVHNIAGPPYSDTIPPNILFQDDEITTPFEYTSSTAFSSVTPAPTSVPPWVAVSSSETKWTYKSTTPSPVTRSSSWVPVSSSETKWTQRPTTPRPVTKSTVRFTEENDIRNRGKENEDISSGNSGHNTWDDDDYIWGSDMNFRWPNSWNHNWGNEWSMKFDTEKTAKPLPTPTPTSGYSKPSGRIKWEGEEYFATSTKDPDRKTSGVFHSSDNSYTKNHEMSSNHKFPSETTTSMRFPDFTTVNHRPQDTSGFPESQTKNYKPPVSSVTKNFMFPEDLPTDKRKVSPSAGNSIKFSEAGSNNRRYDTTGRRNHDYYPVKSNFARPHHGNHRFHGAYGNNRRVSTVPKEPRPTLQGYPIRVKKPTTPQHSQGLRPLGKGPFVNNRFPDSRISVMARPNQPELRPSFSPTLPPRIWTPGRIRGPPTSHRPRG